MKSHVYELIRYDMGANPKKDATIWWDGKEIKSDNKGVIAHMKNTPVNGCVFDDGLEYLKQLPFLYRSGYVEVRRVDKENG